MPIPVEADGCEGERKPRGGDLRIFVFIRVHSWLKKIMTSRSLGHRAPLLWLVLPLMAGLAFGKAFDLSSVRALLAAAALLTAFALWAAWRTRRWFAPAILAAMTLAGAASYALHRPRIAAWDRLPPREARLALRIDRVFTSPGEKKASGLATILRANEPLLELVGQRVYFSFTLRKGEAAPLRSAIISTSGVIAALPRDPPGDTFDGFLANAGINFRLTRGRVLNEERAASAYRQFCARQAARFAQMLGRGVEGKQPELVGVLRAMLLGQQNELSEEQNTIFRESGTMHVFSISGLHIAVIAAGLQALLGLLRLPRVAQLLLGLTALWLYVDITGCAPSAVRAFVMVALVQAAFVLRVPRNPISALAASALLVLLFDPLQLFSASFQMSYGIVAALLLLGLPLADRWQERFALFRELPKVSWGWHRRAIDWLWRTTLVATAIGVAASLVSAITGVLFFKLFTPGALLANLWLIPASTGVILMGFISLLCGLAGFSAGCVLSNHAAVLILLLLEKAVRGFVTVPAMWFGAEFRASWIGALSLAALLLALGAGYANGWRGRHRFYWAPFAVVVVTLLAGVKFG